MTGPRFDLPIDAVLPAIRENLDACLSLVLEAPPGAGKTTAVPLSLLQEDWLAGRKIIMLEPRRLAARAAARRMAELLGEDVGNTVGYSMRLDRKVSKATRIEVVTEGVLVRRLQRDPELADTALVIFDEFHERSLDADFALALALDARAAFREDLRILVMSATLDGDSIARLLDDARVIRSEGRSFPVDTRYLDRSADSDYVAETIRAIYRALAEEDGSILVFLPGVGEIRRAVARLEETGLPDDVILSPLYGDLSAAAQDQAIRPAPPGKRKIVIATAIAETSLTIDGVRVVIDSGRARVPVFDPVSGMSRLDTVRVTASAAAQRRGRAGRVSAGVCYRLWTAAEDRALLPYPAPEITTTDLAGLALELAVWGAGDGSGLRWLTPPPQAALDQARDLLRRLGAIDDNGAVTPHGRDMAALPLHPRLAHMMIRARQSGDEALAALIAAIITDRDPFRGDRAKSDRDLRSRLEDIIARPQNHKRLMDSARQLLGGKLALPGINRVMDRTGVLVALAYPDRIAQMRGNNRGQYQLSNGRGATLDSHDALAGEQYLAIAALDGDKAQARIFLAAPLDRSDLEQEFADQIEDRNEASWNTRDRAVVAAARRCLGALVQQERPANVEPEKILEIMLEGIRNLGLAALPWTDAANDLRARVNFVARHDPAGDWPDWHDETLLETLGEWLAPWLGSMTKASQLDRLDMTAILEGALGWNRLQSLNALAPSHWLVPSGSRLPLDYTGDEPVLAVRLQEMFGALETPAVLNGKVPVTLHLLSPARRPVQVTKDLVSFWNRGYDEVKRDLKGRYPKHYWPDDPRVAEPTSRAKPRK